ncbi:MAG: hypothetical protein WBK55_05215 [Alphaproteobacteria bacterium]
MRGFNITIAGVVAVLAAALPGAALAQNGQDTNPCPLVKPAQINVVPATEKVRYDHSKTLAQLQQTEIDTINPYGFSGVTSLHGYMKATVGVKPQVKVARQREARTGGYCLWYDTIDIRLEISPTIVIGKEIYNDSCLRAATLDHEMKHVNVDRQIVNKYAKIIGQKVYDAIAERGFRTPPVPPEHVKGMNERMTKVVAQVIQFEHDKMQLERMELQRGVDSLEEYERTSRLCEASRAKLPGWATSESKSRKYR